MAVEINFYERFQTTALGASLLRMPTTDAGETPGRRSSRPRLSDQKETDTKIWKNIWKDRKKWSKKMETLKMN